MTTLVTRLKTFLYGKRVGKDSFGNRYYEERIVPKRRRRRRWVVYSGPDEASRVPPVWHAWLHYTIDTPPTGTTIHAPAWKKDHMPNVTGTARAYRPPGHTLQGGRRDKATGDYEPWIPGS
jgi:NADH:ubiquinone oxidoreductase subunit